ncbi:hypothetical protein C0Q70_07678 [Pomacea canaliculata]|uniref:Uncharacterized protein n=1 Tax=Pomacea canaliculata TaxID=400727 RepID=A0A2T7PFP4_POMCA|nr:uncharacterized protein LOC112561406 isoform X3 [Pomacea canaliculata]PVD32245.1 hypothetical protein C0Q70_07678 [Pomacea canaliculata]
MYLSVCLAVAALWGGAWAQSGYDYPGPYGPRQEIELPKVKRVINEAERVADIEEVLKDKLDMSKAEALELLAVLDNISNTTIYDINQVNQRNRERLAKLSARVKASLELLTTLENRLAGAVAQEALIKGQTDAIATSISESLALNRRQRADLAAFVVALREVTQELQQRLAADSKTAASRIGSLAASIRSLVKFVNTRKCFTKAVTVELKGEDSVDTEIPIPKGVFAANDVAQAFCALQGLQQSAEVSQSVAAPAYGASYGSGYPYYPESDDRRFLGVSVVCKAFSDKIRVTVVDQSQGAGNNVAAAYVQVKACSLPAAAFSPGQVFVPKPNKY